MYLISFIKLSKTLYLNRNLLLIIPIVVIIYFNYGNLHSDWKWTAVFDNRVECSSDSVGFGSGLLDVLVKSQLAIKFYSRVFDCILPSYALVVYLNGLYV